MTWRITQALERPGRPRLFSERGPRVVLACGALAYLAVSEWVVWKQAEGVATQASAMGTGLLGGVAGLLVLQMIAVLVFGVTSSTWTLRSDRHCPRPGPELWLILAITAVGLVVRVAALQEVPFGLWFDTAENGNQALRILHDPNYRPVYIAEGTQLPAFFVYLDALSVNWFGQEALAVRLPAALFGAATIPALWWLGRQLGGPPLGLIAAFVLSTSRWHIDFSRLALASIVTPFALTLALASTVAALRADTRNRCLALSALAGLSVSVGLWSYPASALIVPAVCAGVVWWVVRGRLSQLRCRLSRGALVIGVTLAISAITLAPLISLAVRDPDTVFQRSEAVAVNSADGAHAVYESAIQHVLMFTVRGDRNGRHNTPGRPELGWFAPFFLAGIGAALWRSGSAVSLAVPATLLFLATGILTLPFEAPQSHRALLAVIPASLLVALPVALLWSKRRGLTAVLALALGLAGTVESADYFRAQLQESAVYMENSLLETEAARWLRTLPTDSAVLATEQFRTHPTVRFIASERPPVAPAGTALAEFLPLDASRSVAILASADEPAAFNRARALYVDVPIQTFGPPLGAGDPLLFTMFVSRQRQEQTLGFQAETADGALQQVVRIDGSDADTWSATMRVQSTGQYSVNASGARVSIDGESVLTPGDSTASVFLARGAHALRVSRLTAGSLPRLQVLLDKAATAAQPSSGSTGTTDVLFFALPPPGGLLFTWQIEGRPPQALIDSAPHRGFEGTFNDGRPWTAQWRGRLRAPQTGTYAFRIDAVTTASLFLDDRPVVNGNEEQRVSLDSGWHMIRVDYVDRNPYARLFLTWRPPSQEGFTAIPDDLLLPALASPS